jgi:hypothetical protein
MTTDNHFIDQLFKEKLGNFEQDPPVGLLDQINQKILYRSKIRRMNQLKAVIGIAAAMILIFMAGWFTMDQNQIVKNEAPQQLKQLSTPNQTIPEKAPANQVAAAQVKSTNSIPVRQVRQNKTLAVQQNIPSIQPAHTEEHAVIEEPAIKDKTASHQINEGFTKKSMIDEAAAAAKKEKKNTPLYFADAGFKPNNASSEPGKKSWALKAEISPMLATQNQSGITPNTKSGSSISGGMIASYKMNDKITISSGIRLSQMKQGSHSDYTMAKTSGITYLQPVQKDANLSGDVSLYLPPVSSIVYSNGMQTTADNTFSSDVSQEFKYLEVPIQATYNLLNKKISVGVTGGLSTNFLVSNFASVTENGIKLSQGSTNNMRDVLYAGSAGIELGYDLGKNLVLTVEPRVKQYINSISSNEQVSFRPMQLGLFTGITYCFK